MKSKTNRYHHSFATNHGRLCAVDLYTLVLTLVCVSVMLCVFLAEKVTGQSQQVTYVYDSLNRVTEVRYSTTVIHYSYDAAGNRTMMQIEGSNPAPTLINLSPGSALAGSSEFMLTITGSNFVGNAVVKWNGADRPTTFVSESQVQAMIPGTDVTDPGTASITVNNPAPGGGTSNTLNFPIIQNCSFSIAPTNQSFPPAGGNGTINITSPNGCDWSATSNATWITINSGAIGSSNGTVSFTVAANTDAAQRTDTITAAGQTFTVNQAGTGCSYSIAPASATYGSDGGNGTINITATDGCNWTATANDFWITITSSSIGSGNGVVNYSIDTNANFGSRMGTINITGQTFTVTQDGAVQPTAIKLDALLATGYDNGVFIQWQTGLEVENLGFNIYREQQGQRTLITPEIVAGSALLAGNKTTLTAGRSYAWWDSLAKDQQDTQYWLEDIDLDGKSTFYGPVQPKPIGGLPPSESTAALLSRIGIGQPKFTQISADPLAPSEPSQKQIESQWEIATKPAIKMTIKEEGWYRITQPELVAAGLNPGTDPRNLQLFVSGQEQAMLVVGEQDGVFDAKDAIEFYGVGQDIPTTDAHTYWLVSGKQLGKRIGIVKSDGSPGGASSFPYTVERKEKTIYFAGLKNGEAENFFGRVVMAEPLAQELMVQHLDQSASAAELEVALQGVTDLPGSPDHLIRVTLNGEQVGKIAFDGQQHKVEEITVPLNRLKEGENIVSLLAEGGPSDISLVDYIRLTYHHTYTADQDALKFTLEKAKPTDPAVEHTQTITGFNSALIRVIDVTNASDPQELAGRIDEQKSGGFSVTVNPRGDLPRTILSFTSDQIKRPAAITLNQPSNWRSSDHTADLLIISNRAFISSLAPLKTLRQKQGYAVEIVDIEDIFDEFSFGEKQPRAIKDFLSTIKGSWKKAPRFLLFVGDASFDPRNYLGAGDFDLVPSKLIDTDYLETASDDWFVDFKDEGLPELSVGRLPVRTESEARALVDKIVANDSVQTKDPTTEKSVLLVADKNDGYDFEAATRQLRALIPARTSVQEIYRGRTDDATAKKQLIDAINRGQWLVNYIGHGSANSWRSIFAAGDIQSLNNKGRLPLFVTMTCLNGFFQDPTTESLAEGLLKYERSGAIAVWASSGLTLPAQQAVMNQQLVRMLFDEQKRLTIGEITLRAKASVNSADIRRSWILFGDPTMRLR